MKLEIPQIPPYLKKLPAKIKGLGKYLPLIAFLLFMLVCSGLVLQIGQLSRQDPSDDAVSEKLSTIKTPKIDPATLKKIQQLQDQNVDVKSLFDQARNNPFSE